MSFARAHWQGLGDHCSLRCGQVPQRTETLQQMPVSVSVFSQAGLAFRNLTDISQLADFTPNVEFDFTAR